MTTGVALLDGITDTQAVLGCAGLSAGDISDTRLVATLIEDDLALRLYEQLPLYQTHIEAGALDSATPNQKMIARAIRAYTKWLGATILVSRWLLFKQMASDGKTRNDRFDRMDLAAMQANINGQAAHTWAILARLLDPNVERRVPVFFGISQPETDPVTDLDV